MEQEALEQQIEIPVTVNASITLTMAEEGEEGVGEEFAPCAVHHTGTSDKSWDAAANEKRLPSPMPVATARAMYGWMDSSKAEGGNIAKSACKFPHHEVSADGSPGAANMAACSSVVANLNGGRTPPNISDADRKGVHTHVAAHMRDGKKEVPPLKNAADTDTTESASASANASTKPVQEPEIFASVTSILPSSLDSKDRTVDVCWYGGAMVPRIDRSTGEQYMLKLDPLGCDMQRLNAGAPVFDSHMTGMDFPSMLANNMGMKAQVGTVLKAWTENGKCLATLKFSSEQAADAIWQKVSEGIARNLSFGTWIYSREENGKVKANGSEMASFTATAWEPFEISVVGVPADFTTEFLSAAGAGGAPEIVAAIPAATAAAVPAATSASVLQDITAAARQFAKEFADNLNSIKLSATEVVPTRATSPQEGNHMADTQATTGAEARETAPPAATAPATAAVDVEKLQSEAASAAVAAERTRASSIRSLASKFPNLEQKFIDALIDKGTPLADARIAMLDELARQSDALNVGGARVTRDETATRRAAMEAYLLHRINPAQYPLKDGFGADYRGMTLLDIGRECLNACGVRTRGMERGEIARVALQGRHFGAEEYFVGAQGTSDFPNILANVATKLIRIGYEMAPRTFQPFTRRFTAPDFKQMYAVQLSDIPVMTKVNEHGEFDQANISDSKETMQVLTYGQIINITRQAIVNDNLQMLDAIPTKIGRGAAALENSLVWAVITGNAAMADTVAIFHSTHANLETGVNSALGLTGLANARKALRIQTGPKSGTLNLLPKSIAVPAALENTMLQLLNPLQLAATAVTGVIPRWITELTPNVEPLLDANSTAYWYLFGDPAMIDIIGYAYLEGQEGVYTETKQGFEVDGVQVKGRLDFGVAMLDHRGAVRSNGA